MIIWTCQTIPLRPQSDVLAGAVIAGQAIALPSLGVLAWSAGFVLSAVFFFIGYWQPTPRRRYGDQYEAFVRSLPAWIPGRPRRRGSRRSVQDPIGDRRRFDQASRVNAESNCALGLFDMPASPRARASARSWTTVHVWSGMVRPSAAVGSAAGRPEAAASSGPTA